MSDFVLHERLEADTAHIADLNLSTMLLMRDARYPWVILVPRRAGIREIHELEEEDQVQLLRETSAVSEAMQRMWQADKMNVATLGNMVPQLHVHVIARFEGDDAWPKPVWGQGESLPYDRKSLDGMLARLNAVVREV